MEDSFHALRFKGADVHFLNFNDDLGVNFGGSDVEHGFKVCRGFARHGVGFAVLSWDVCFPGEWWGGCVAA